MEFEPIKLETREPANAERTRRLLAAKGVINPHRSDHSLSVRVIFQRRRNSDAVLDGADEWSDLERIHLSRLEAGQEVAIELDTAQTAQLFEHLKGMYAIAAEGVAWGDMERVVLPADEAEVFAQLSAALEASPQRRAQLINAIRTLDPAVFDLAAHQARYERETQALADFASHLEANDWDESEWEAFFKSNRWIFGHGLAYQFLSEIQVQPNYGAQNVSGQGGQRGDHLMASEAQVRFTVLVEVKTPGTDLVQRIPYRNGVHAPAKDVAGGVAQLQVNARTWEVEGSQSESNRDLEGNGVFTVSPRGILVVGNTDSLDSREKRNSFELFRRGLHTPEVVTFDELLARARFVVEHELNNDDPDATDASWT